MLRRRDDHHSPGLQVNRCGGLRIGDVADRLQVWDAVEEDVTFRLARLGAAPREAWNDSDSMVMFSSRICRYRAVESAARFVSPNSAAGRWNGSRGR